MTWEPSWRQGKVLTLAVALAMSLAAVGSGSAAAATSKPPVRSLGFLPSGQTGPRSAVPWRQVGDGWTLVMYWPGRYAFGGKAKAAAPVLYLFDPAGGRYQLYRWPVTKNPPYLEDWSGDKTRALLSLSGGGLEQLVLASGRITRTKLPRQANLIGYTRPAGHGLLVWRGARSPWRISRYRLDGRLAKVLISDAHSVSAVYSGTGRTLAVGAPNGLWLVSNRGGIVRTLPVPGASAGCIPARWRNSEDILASCEAKGASGSRLWLVPAGGQRPRPLTARLGKHAHVPYLIDAWNIGGRLYLQALTSSGGGRIFRRAQSGRIVRVRVPGTAGNNWIITARGSQLLIAAEQPPCSNSQSQSLLSFSPATSLAHSLVTTPHGLAGVIGTVPYDQPVADVYYLVACASADRLAGGLQAADQASGRDSTP